MNAVWIESAWTDERIAQLKQMWKDGLSCSRIARELGGFAHCGDGGRSAVIGKVHRLGLSGRAARGNDRHRRPAAGNIVSRGQRQGEGSLTKSLRNRVRRAAAAAEQRPPAEEEPILPATDVVDLNIPVEQRRIITTLEYGDCKWPVGDPLQPDFFFCGGPAMPVPGSLVGAKRSFCAAHYRRAYQRVSENRRSIKPLW